ncbi:delta-aminolevulinic acid dehydratase [Helicobacter sp. 13S00401-1]|uniref:porphobilinogen synthase n=1 Tax=Helicobacter sp. 13S00401-1 TaxID=1905758 RepID=UPI000BA5F47A|nr:porphobilinogen synthase [Helicobacter sp. 13S00401-1]PAF51121.1 delta-aminolevulinic acid dehydratase [Helicobacter sp. 13S00401-1]
MFRRARRLRINGQLRELVQDIRLDIKDFIYPLFVMHGSGIKNEIASMPGVFQMSIDEILKECEVLLKLGIKNILLFGLPAKKDAIGSEALDGENFIVAKCIRAIKKEMPEMLVVADVCFCEYTDHGHCGILDKDTVNNDLTLANLAKQSVILASAGCDVIAPSSMMDGQVYAIRKGLDEAGFINTPIMSYSTKFSSSYYGPFRDVADSAPSFGDRKSYQQDFANTNDAILESLSDEKEGADILMVKPALAYLDVVHAIKQASLLPLAVYNVSGEYALLQAGKKLGIIDYDKLVLENMIAFKRAGADIIISYHAKEVAGLLKGAN